jgi:hypothetical protein
MATRETTWPLSSYFKINRFKTSVAPPLWASLSASPQPIQFPTVPVNVTTPPSIVTLMSSLFKKGLQKKRSSMFLLICLSL